MQRIPTAAFIWPTLFLLLGMAMTGCESTNNQTSSPPEKTQVPITSSTDSTNDELLETQRNAFAAGLSSILRRHGIDASAVMVNKELVISGEDLERRSQRDTFAGSTFTKQVQQKLCDVDVHKVLIAAKGLFSDSNEYDMNCRLTPEELKRRTAGLQAGREAFAKQMTSDLKASPVVDSVEARGTELVLNGKSEMNVQAVSSSFLRGMGSSFISSTCEIGFTGLRVRKPSLEKGIFVPFHCSKRSDR